MKKNILLFTIVLFAAACGNNKADEPDTDELDTLTTTYRWEAILNDSTGRLEVNKSELPGPDSLAAPAVIAFLNKRNVNVQMELVKVSGDTLYVKIPDAMYLTQQMGSAGPQLFFAETVYNLTEIPGIRYINFDFEEGDHASPSVLNRNSFKNE